MPSRKAMMKLSEQWITQRGEAIVVGLCKECHRTYGHDDDCRVGALVQLEADNERLLRVIDEVCLKLSGVAIDPLKEGNDAKSSKT